MRRGGINKGNNSFMAKKKEKKLKKKTKKISSRRKEKLTQKKKKRKVKEAKLQYWEGIGRRKTAVARVRVYREGEKEIIVNDKSLQEYFFIPELLQLAIAPLKKFNLLNQLRVTVKVKGGGASSQAEAVRHGLARALVKLDENYRAKLRKLGFLTRDPRERERKKPGLKRARRAPQWSKR